jgi:hypothetical protein
MDLVWQQVKLSPVKQVDDGALTDLLNWPLNMIGCF